MTGAEIKRALLTLHQNASGDNEKLIMKYLLGKASINIKDYGTLILSEKEPVLPENEDYKNIYEEMKKKEEAQKKGFVSKKRDAQGDYVDLKRVVFLVFSESNTGKGFRVKKELIVENVKAYELRAMGEQSMLQMITADGRDVSIKLSPYNGYKVEDMENDEE